MSRLAYTAVYAYPWDVQDETPSCAGYASDPSGEVTAATLAQAPAWDVPCGLRYTEAIARPRLPWEASTMLIGLIALTAVLMVSLLRVRRALAPAHSQAPNQAAGVLGDLLRSRGELVAENALLRQQLIIPRRRTERPRFTRLDRLLVVLLARRVRAWRQALLIVRPDTLLRWHRAGFRLLWRRRSQARSSTRRLDPQVVALIQHLARENRLWGAERIRGELLKLGVRVCKRTIQKYILCRAETTIIVDPGA